MKRNRTTEYDVDVVPVLLHGLAPEIEDAEHSLCQSAKTAVETSDSHQTVSHCSTSTGSLSTAMSAVEENVQPELKKAKCIRLMNALKVALRAPQNQRIFTDEIQAKMFEDLEQTHSDMHTGRPIEVDANEWANWETYKEDVEAFHDHWWAMVSLAAEYGGNKEPAQSPLKSEINKENKNENKAHDDSSPSEFWSSSHWTALYHTTTWVILLYCAITCSYLLHQNRNHQHLRNEPLITSDGQSTMNIDVANDGVFQIKLQTNHTNILIL